MARLLLEHSADVNARDEHSSTSSRLASKGRAHRGRMPAGLVEHGANVLQMQRATRVGPHFSLR